MEYNGMMKYDKIYDIVMHLGPNCLLKFNVSLSYQNPKNNNRQFMYSEYEYKSGKYGGNLVSIRRDADYYLSLENVIALNGHDKAFIRIGHVEIVKLKTALQVCYEWFHDTAFSSLFITSHGVLMIGHAVNPFIVDNLPMGKYLKFEPCVVERVSTGELLPGVSMELGQNGNTVEMDIHLFHAFREVINSFNMYLAYSIMVNSIISRADFSPINRFSIGGGEFNAIEEEFTNIPKTNNTTGQSGVNGRRLLTIDQKKKRCIEDL